MEAARPGLLPQIDRDADHEQVAPHRGEQIFMAGGMGLIGHAVVQPGFAQSPKPPRQHRAGDAQTVQPVVEALRPAEGFAQDQHGPAITDHVQRVGDGIVLDHQRALIAHPRSPTR
jgi:hypothetical protein